MHKHATRQKPHTGMQQSRISKQQPCNTAESANRHASGHFHADTVCHSPPKGFILLRIRYQQLLRRSPPKGFTQLRLLLAVIPDSAAALHRHA